MTSLEIAKLAIKALDSKKGEDIKLIKVENVSILSDYLVLATGSSNTKVRALYEEVEEKLGEDGISVSHIEGYRGNSWVLMDYIDVVVHVFSDEARTFYDLDKLWQDGENIDISDILT